MQHLHAPWRIQYILAPKTPLEVDDNGQTKSIFLKMLEENDDEKNLIIARGKICFAILNNYPYNGGHLMVLPNRQVATIGELCDEELLEMMRMVQICQKAITKLMHPDGFNIGINQGKVAGAGIVEHLHIHVVPRWNGDSNFMPVIAETSVLPQALQDVAKNLRSIIRELM